MKKIVLIDGNSFIFRAFYATYYSGNSMKTSENIPTNALYGYINFIEAIIEKSQPDYVFVALDKGSNTFRKKLYIDYKAHRQKAPNELVSQFKLIREYMKFRNISYLEHDDFEADDIIGSLANKFEKEMQVEIYTGDQDYLQLVKDNTKVSIIKKGGLSQSVLYDQELINFDYGVYPKTFIDLKAIMGDKSDNIPGVFGIGEKTAIKYLQKYETLENLYEQIKLEKDTKTKEKFILNEENAFLSKKLATIITNQEFDIELENLKINLKNDQDYIDFLKKYELNSILKKISSQEQKQDIVEQTVEVEFNNLKFENAIWSYFVVTNEDSYHFNQILYLICNANNKIQIIEKPYLTKQFLMQVLSSKTIVFDSKKTNFLLKQFEIDYINFENDLMVMSYVVNATDTSNDIYKYKQEFSLDIISNKELLKQISQEKTLINYALNLNKFFNLANKSYLEKIKEQNLISLYEMEHKLAHVLFNMENRGIHFNVKTNQKMLVTVEKQLNLLEKKIHSFVDVEFNINSPKQLGTILFETLQIPYPKKKTTKSYSTAVEILEKLILCHPIIIEILQYRKLNKLASTYLLAFEKYLINSKIHTVYNQCKTATGRLSSNYPNLQNIPTRSEIGKQVRESFEAQKNKVLVSIDYSQIELRVIAAIAKEKHMLNAFSVGYDIHKDTAAKVLNIDYEEVTVQQRKMAKAINFGIIYGMGPFKLAQDLNISQKQAKEFIAKYHKTYENISHYIDNIIISAQEKEYVETYFKRKRYLPQINDKNKTIAALNQRIAINSPIQGTAAEILKLAMIKIEEIFKNSNEVSLLLQIHDELVFEIEETKVKEITDKLIEIMENIVDIGVNLECNYKVGKNWYNLK